MNYLDVFLPERWLTVLDIPEVVEDSVTFVLSVVSPHGVPVVDGAVDGPAGQGGDEPDHGDDGERGDNFPPHIF